MSFGEELDGVVGQYLKALSLSSVETRPSVILVNLSLKDTLDRLGRLCNE